MKKELKGIDGKVAIHCTTQEEYTQVLDLIPMDAKKRESMNFGFGKYGNETCIADYGLCYGRIDFWKSEGYTIITAAEFIAMNTEPESDSKIVGADMICPITKKHCDDECCTIGSECNMSGDEISNTEPEADKERKLLEAFRDYLKTRGIWSWTVEIDNFLSSLRKPAFELICQDGVVTDPEQIVWVINNGQLVRYNAGMALGKTCYIQKSAANNHRLHNTPAIKLSDMTYDAESESYCIGLNAAHNLVNERIK